MTRFSVTWIVYGPLDQPTGGYVYDRTIVRGLVAGGHALEVVSIAPGSDAGELARRLDQIDADVIVGDGLAIPELARAFVRTTSAALRVLLVHHLTSWESEHAGNGALRELEARAIAASDTLITTSRASAARIAREHERHAEVVAPGADRLPRSVRHASSEARLELVAIGSLIPRKRIGLVLDALEAANNPAIGLRIVGDPTRDRDYARAITARADALGASVVGSVSDAALGEELARADVMVLASALEGYGMALTEARHAGLPALLARSAVVADAVGDFADVLVFDDARELTSLLERLLADRALLGRLSAASRAASERVPGWAAATEAFRLTLARALAARAPARAVERAR